MANHKSAQKRSVQTLKRNKVNRQMLIKLKKNVNEFQSLLSSGKANELKDSLSKVNSSLSKLLKKGLIKKNFASRKLSSLSKKIK